MASSTKLQEKLTHENKRMAPDPHALDSIILSVSFLSLNRAGSKAVWAQSAQHSESVEVYPYQVGVDRQRPSAICCVGLNFLWLSKLSHAHERHRQALVLLTTLFKDKTCVYWISGITFSKVE
ncbi:hypothetical protein TRVL_05364 [Trypanosoma vivax]|nr:hypothetical protein TRVL_05364 [Trypanosoma vivax]